MPVIEDLSSSDCWFLVQIVNFYDKNLQKVLLISLKITDIVIQLKKSRTFHGLYALLSLKVNMAIRSDFSLFIFHLLPE